MLFSVFLIAVHFLRVPARAAGPGGIHLDSLAHGLPQLTLSDTTYQAAQYDADGDIYIWKNIRFAAAPLGDLRWAKPAAPPHNETLQDGSYGNKCPQVPINGYNNVGWLADVDPLGKMINELISLPLEHLYTGGEEDCLFLDMYVPGKAIRKPHENKLAVIVWLFGGGFLFGDKAFVEPILPFYDGTGLVEQSEGNVIFISANYRLGAFGWLAGSTMEKEGLPNAGLWDQRAVFQWVQDNIELVGGDKSAVTAMGLSSGGASIMHHLVAEGGTLDPLFHRAILLSPAFEPMFDRQGLLESAYRQFESLAGCSGHGVSCLRGLQSETLLKANIELSASTPDGTFALGPATDGQFIRQLPTLEFSSGKFYKDITGLILSHTINEADVFVDGNVTNDKGFSSFTRTIFPAYTNTTGLDAYISSRYPPVESGRVYLTEAARQRAVISDAAVLSNVRVLTNAYKGKSWNMQYAIWPGWHGADNLPVFLNADIVHSTLSAALAFAAPLFTSLSKSYKGYITSFARSGDPNAMNARLRRGLVRAIYWPTANAEGEPVKNVLNIGPLGYSLVEDGKVGAEMADFWVDWLAGATEAGGYAPPEARVQSPMIRVIGNASLNYR